MILPTTISERGTVMTAMAERGSEIVSIMIRMPMIMVMLLMISVIELRKVSAIVSTSLVIRERVSPKGT